MRHFWERRTTESCLQCPCTGGPGAGWGQVQVGPQPQGGGSKGLAVAGTSWCVPRFEVSGTLYGSEGPYADPLPGSHETIIRRLGSVHLRIQRSS